MPDARIAPSSGKDYATFGVDSKEKESVLRRMVIELLVGRKEKNEFACLDGVRSLAFLWVCGFHALIYGLGVDHLFGKDRKQWNEWNYYRFERPLLNAFSCGYLGVTVFLALSAFLLTHVLHAKFQKKETKKTVIEFYCGRFFRIWPALAVAAYVSQPLSLWAQSQPFSAWSQLCTTEEDRTSFLVYWWHQISLFLNFRNDIFLIGCKGTTVFWTCALEFQFYLALPPIVYLHAKKYRFTAIFILLCISVLSLILRAFNTVHRYHSIRKGYFGPNWYLASLQGDWTLYSRPWYRISEYCAGILGYFAFLEILPLQHTFSALLSKKKTVTLSSRRRARQQSSYSSQDEHKSTTPTMSDTVVVDFSSDSDSDSDSFQNTASRADERKRRFILAAIETLSALFCLGFICCRLQSARAAYNHSHHDNFNLWLSTHPNTTIITATIEPTLVALMVALACASMCAAGDQTAPLLRLIRSFLNAKFWYPIASLSFTGYLLSGVAISYERHRPAFASDGGFLARYFCFVIISLSLGLCLSLTVERPAILLGKTLFSYFFSYTGPTFYTILTSIYMAFMDAAAIPHSAVDTSPLLSPESESGISEVAPAP